VIDIAKEKVKETRHTAVFSYSTKKLEELNSSKRAVKDFQQAKDILKAAIDAKRIKQNAVAKPSNTAGKKPQRQVHFSLPKENVEDQRQLISAEKEFAAVQEENLKLKQYAHQLEQQSNLLATEYLKRIKH